MHTKTILLFLAALCLPVGAAHAEGEATLQLVAPTRYVRPDGVPVAQFVDFTAAFPGPAVLKVINGNLEDSTVEMVSSSVISLNGQIVFAPSEFSQNVSQLEKQVVLVAGTNRLEVELRGKPGGEIACTVVQPISSLHVEPSSITLASAGATAQLTLAGTLSDGTPVDVTAAGYGTTYTSAAPATAIVSSGGLVTAVASGRTSVTVRLEDFEAAVPVAVGASPPVLSNLRVEYPALPLPRELEEFSQVLTFDFSDPDADIRTLNLALHGPAGEIWARSENVGIPDDLDVPPQPSGSGRREIPFDATYPPGAYEIQVELVDALGNSSGVQRIGFSLDAGAPRVLDVTGMEPSTGSPGDRVVIAGLGFDPENAAAYRVHFQDWVDAEILSVTPTAIEAVVPPGALTGTVVVTAPSGRAASPLPFNVPASIAILPGGTRLLTGDAVDFSVVQNGLRSTSIGCLLNGLSAPEPALGQLETFPGGFTYTAPAAVPPGGRVTVRCGSADDPSIQASVEIDVAAPPPPPGEALIRASEGGVIESERGDASLAIPAGALSSDATITIEQLDPDTLPWSIENGFLLAAVTLGPSGTVFAEPARLRLPLRNAEPPGAEIPLFLLDASGGLTASGSVAVVDGSGLFAEGLITHFSTFVASRTYTTPEVAAQETVRVAVPTYASEFSVPDRYFIGTAPDMRLLEGHSVPVIIQRSGGPLPGVAGPFSEPSLLTVTLSTASSTVGPVMTASPDGWQLGTVLNFGVLPSCGARHSEGGTLTVGYTRAGLPQTLTIPYLVQCLDELDFTGTRPPAFLPAGMTLEAGDEYIYDGLRLSKDSAGRYVVALMEPWRTYGFSMIYVGPGGTLTYHKYVPSAEIPMPYVVEVTGLVRVGGTIDLRGVTGGKGGVGGVACADCGGAAGLGTQLHSAIGGRGGDFRVRSSELYPCAGGTYYPVGSSFVTICPSGERGGTPLLQTYGGGAG